MQKISEILNLLLATPGNLWGFAKLLFEIPKNDPAASFVYLLVGIMGLSAILFTMVKSVQVWKNLSKVNQKVKLIQGGSAYADGSLTLLEQIQNAMAEVPSMKQRWTTFESTLSKEAYTTLEPSTFFHEAALVDAPLKQDLLKHVPGILTALGIIGTFAGLISGLQKFDANNLQGSIAHLLTSVGAAFTCSFLAVFLAVLLNFIDKAALTLLYNQVSTLQEELGRLFHRSVAEKTLDEMSDIMRRQTDTLRQAMDDMASGLTNAIQAIPTEQERALQQLAVELGRAQNEMLEKIGATITESLSKPLNELRDTMVEMAKKQANAQGEQLGSLIESFAQSLKEAGGNQAEELRQIMKDTSANLDRMMGTMENLMLRSSEQQQLMTQEVHQSLKALQGNLQGLQEGLMDQGRQHLENITQGLMESSQRGLALQEEMMKRLDQRVNASGTAFTQQTQAVIAELQEQMVQQRAQVQADAHRWQTEQSQIQAEASQRTSEMVDQLEDQTTALVDSLQEITAKLEQQQSDWGHGLRAMLGTLQEGQVDWQTNSAAMLDRQEQLLASQNELLTQHDLRLTKSRELVDQLAQQSQHLQKSTDNMLAVGQRLALSAENGQQLAEGNLRAIQSLQTAVQSTQSLTQSLQGQMEQHGQVMGQMGQSFNQLMVSTQKNLQELDTTLSSNLGKYNNLTKEQFGKFLGDVDAQLKTAVSRLASLMEELNEVVEDFTQGRN